MCSSWGCENYKWKRSLWGLTTNQIPCIQNSENSWKPIFFVSASYSWCFLSWLYYLLEILHLISSDWKLQLSRITHPLFAGWGIQQLVDSSWGRASAYGRMTVFSIIKKFLANLGIHTCKSFKIFFTCYSRSSFPSFYEVHTFYLVSNQHPTKCQLKLFKGIESINRATLYKAPHIHIKVSIFPFSAQFTTTSLYAHSKCYLNKNSCMNDFSGKAKYACISIPSLEIKVWLIIIILYLTTDFEVNQQFFQC